MGTVEEENINFLKIIFKLFEFLMISICDHTPKESHL